MPLSRFYSPVAAILFAVVCLADPTTTRGASGKTGSVRQILELPKPSWLENLAVRPNGEILATRVDKPEVYLIAPHTGSYSVIATFSDVSSVGGIAEYAPDVYAVSVGNFSIQDLRSIPASFSLWSIDLSKKESLDADGKLRASSIKMLSNVSDAHNLNGLTFRPPHTLYAGDAYAYKIWEIDTRTGAYRAAVENEPLLRGGSILPLGVNGLRWNEKKQALFFTNTDQILVGMLKLRHDGSGAFDPAEKIATHQIGKPYVSAYDDFALDEEGNVYAVTSLGNTVDFVARDGSSQFTIAGDKTSSDIEGPTAAQFGRTPADRNTLYVVTNGGFVEPINGTVTTGARVIAIECDEMVGTSRDTWNKQEL